VELLGPVVLGGVLPFQLDRPLPVSEAIGCGLVLVVDPKCPGTFALARDVRAARDVSSVPLFWVSKGSSSMTQSFRARFRLAPSSVFRITTDQSESSRLLEAMDISGTPTILAYDEYQVVQHVLLTSRLPPPESWKGFCEGGAG
jgi:hypothetical protein